MRLKRLFNNEVLYFQHTPPYTDLDNVSESKKLQPPFTNAPAFMCTPYFYWWAFMREWDDYTQCCKNGGEGALAHLYDDFGDLRGMEDDDFMKWWIKGGRNLFCEPKDQGVKFLPSAPISHDNENRVLISVPLDGDLDRILAEIRSGIGREMRERYGDEDRRVSRANRLRKEYKQKTKVQIAYDIGLVRKADRTFNPDSVISQVSEHYSKACALVSNLATGRFPDYSIPEPKSDLFG